jgi:hypothetical protein
MPRDVRPPLKEGEHVEDIDIPEFIATVAAQLKEANKRTNERIRATKDDPFLLLQDIQLQIAFTAEESKTTEGHLELKPWVVSAGGGKTKGTRDEIVHTVTINLTPALPGSVANMEGGRVETSDRGKRIESGYVVGADIGEIGAEE